MKSIETQFDLKHLRAQLKGALYWKKHYRMLYATDGSVYKKLPLAVAYPKDKEDIKIILTFAKKNNIGISFSLWDANGDKFIIFAVSGSRDLENRIP